MEALRTKLSGKPFLIWSGKKGNDPYYSICRAIILIPHSLIQVIVAMKYKINLIKILPQKSHFGLTFLQTKRKCMKSSGSEGQKLIQF